MTHSISLSNVEQHLSEQGNFCLLDWLIAKNLLPYALYETWRYGKNTDMASDIDLSKDALLNIIKITEKCCGELKLQAEAQVYFCWGNENQQVLTASKDKAIHTALTQSWLRPQGVPQLDLFMDNSAIIAENNLRHALASRQFDAAQEKLQQLTALNPKHARLGGYQDLINYGLHMQSQPIIEEDALHPELMGLKQEVLTLAKEMLGSASRDYLAFAWRRLGASIGQMPFDPATPELHGSYVFAQIPDWEAVTQNLLLSKALYPTPLLMERLAYSFENQQETFRALVIWCLLVEQHSVYAEETIESKQSASIYRLWEDFWEATEEGPQEYFPAYVLARHAGLIHTLEEFPPLVHPATSTMIELIKARINGDSEVSGREKLQAIDPRLLQLYINIRAK